MPNKTTHKKTSKKSSENEELHKEIAKLRKSIDALHEDVKKLTPAPGWKRFLHNLWIGITRGLGIIIGTTIVAGLVFLLLQQLWSAGVIQEWINGAVTEIIEQSINEAVQERFPRR